MELRVRDVVDLLQVSEKTLYRWIGDQKIPAYKIYGQYRFNKSELYDWILLNRLRLGEEVLAKMVEGLQGKPLSTLIQQGGIHYEVGGEGPEGALTACVEAAKLPDGTDREALVRLLLSRERLMPTAIGRGIALPHPRTPFITDLHGGRVAVCFLRKPVDFGALDGLPVHTVFLVISSNTRQHLEALSRLAFLCQDAEFRSLLEKRASREALVGFIQEKEHAWGRRELHGG